KDLFTRHSASPPFGQHCLVMILLLISLSGNFKWLCRELRVSLRNASRKSLSCATQPSSTIDKVPSPVPNGSLVKSSSLVEQLLILIVLLLPIGDHSGYFGVNALAQGLVARPY